MADIFQEVDEELRQERAAKLWNKYGIYLIAAAVAIVVAIGGSRMYREWQQSEWEATSQRYQSAEQKAADGDVEGARAELAAVMRDGGAGYAALARLRDANLAVEADGADAARALYEGIVADAAVPDAYRDVARLHAARLALDGGDAAAVEGLVGALADGEGAWRYAALELRALALIATGDNGAAATALEGLTDGADTPPRLRARAAELRRAIGG